MKQNKSDTWLLATTWTRSNHVLIRCIAGPYIRHMPCDAEDLTCEALLVAYQTIMSLQENSGDLELMSRYFQVRFKTHCIKMAAGVPTVTLSDIATIPLLIEPEHLDQNHQKFPLEKINNLTKRQREISLWILSQDIPVNTKKIGAHFGVSARAIRLIINNAVVRLNGNSGIRKDIPVAA